MQNAVSMNFGLPIVTSAGNIESGVGFAGIETKQLLKWFDEVNDVVAYGASEIGEPDDIWQKFLQAWITPRTTGCCATGTCD